MSAARTARMVGLLCGLAVLALAGSALGGGWWLAAALGAAGALTGRPGSLAHAVATLTLAGAAPSADATWLVPLLVLGVVATVETAALPARIDRVRTSVPVRPALVAPIVAAGCAAAVLTLSNLAPTFAVPVALAGVLAATALLTTLRA